MPRSRRQAAASDSHAHPADWHGYQIHPYSRSRRASSCHHESSPRQFATAWRARCLDTPPAASCSLPRECDHSSTAHQARCASRNSPANQARHQARSLPEPSLDIPCPSRRSCQPLASGRGLRFRMRSAYSLRRSSQVAQFDQPPPPCLPPDCRCTKHQRNAPASPFPCPRGDHSARYPCSQSGCDWDSDSQHRPPRTAIQRHAAL